MKYFTEQGYECSPLLKEGDVIEFGESEWDTFRGSIDTVGKFGYWIKYGHTASIRCSFGKERLIRRKEDS